MIAAAAQWASAILMLLKMVGLGYLITKILDFTNTIRKISFFFDKILLKLIDKMYDYFTILSRNEFFDADTLKAFASRIYLFIGIIIFFKLSITIIKFVGNPDSVHDEKVGMGAILKKSAIGLVLIVLMPTFFDLALKLQAAILNDNVIPYIITGQKQQKNQQQYTVGQNIGFTVYSGFSSISVSASSNQKRQYKRAEDFKDLDLIEDDLIIEKSKEKYVIDYFPLVSTAALAFVLFQMLTMCLNVAIRMVALGILEMISPIIIVDYMVDTGKDTFGNWLKATVSAYVKIFIDVAMLWFIVFFLDYITLGKSPLLKQNNDKMLIALVLIGLFLFTKKIPGLVSKIFGVDLDSTASDFLKGMPGKVMGLGQKTLGVGKKLGSSAINTGRNAMRFGSAFKGARKAGGSIGSAIGAGVRGMPNKTANSLAAFKKERTEIGKAAAKRQEAKNLSTKFDKDSILDKVDSARIDNMKKIGKTNTKLVNLEFSHNNGEISDQEYEVKLKQLGDRAEKLSNNQIRLENINDVVSNNKQATVRVRFSGDAETLNQKTLAAADIAKSVDATRLYMDSNTRKEIKEVRAEMRSSESQKQATEVLGQIYKQANGDKK